MVWQMPMKTTQQQLAYWRQIAKSEPANPVAQFNCAWWASKAGDFDVAIAGYERAIALQLLDPEEAMTNLASVYSERLGDSERALVWLERALERKPDHFPAVFNRAHLAEQVGDRSTAIAYFQRARQLDPENAASLARLAEAWGATDIPEAVLNELRVGADQADPDILLALARIEEQRGRYGAAWQALLAANHADATGRPAWPASRYLTHLESLTAPTLDQTPTVCADPRGPVFIVGMFRTGSTLLEQLLAAHPSFMPLGESEFWPREIAALGGGMLLPPAMPEHGVRSAVSTAFDQHCRARAGRSSERVTDKRPDNLYHIGLIASVLPNARFVITERDWRDTLLSVLGTRLHPQHGYATHIPAIREQLRVCADLAERWHRHMPERVYRFRYEALLADPENALRQLLSWLHEPWDPACLHFHQLTNSVRTASVWQVRVPLQADRAQRWPAFQEHIAAALAVSVSELSAADPYQP